MADERIDTHAHLIGPRYREAITAGAPSGPPLPPAGRLELERMMSAYGIDRAVISTGPPGAIGPDQQRINEVSRLANEELAEIVGDAPDRFAGLALLPLPDADAALAELAYALDELALDGVIMFSNLAGTYLGDARWDRVFAELDRRQAYVFLHPGFPPTPPPLATNHPVWLYEFPFETTRAVANLIYSGTLERNPRIRLQLAHLGGTVPFLAHRIASLADREPDRAAGAPAGVVSYLRPLFYDTGLTNDLPPIAATRQLLGTDGIVFGTDWPYAALPKGGDPAPALRSLTSAERRAIDARNALALVPRWR